MIDKLGLAGFFLLHHEMLELAREVAVEVRGPDSVRALLAPGRGRGSSVSSLVCYLTGLSHIDPIANELLLGRFLHEDLQRAARHRPRLPARHPRGADPARARSLRARPRRAGGGLPHLPRARGDPRARQGARPAGRGRSSGWRAAPSATGRRARHDDPGPRRPTAAPATGVERARGRGDEAVRLARALALAGAPGRAGPRAAAPPVPALRRHDRRDPAADRLLPGRAGGDGGSADGPVGQGLLRRRGLPEDRPAGPGHALGGRALRGEDRAPARRAHRPLAHPLRRPETFARSARPTPWASFRSRAARRCSRCCARARRTSTT